MPRILERINSSLGYRAVSALRIVQGPVIRDDQGTTKDISTPAPDETGLERIEKDKLRAALARLGANVDRNG